MVEEERVLLRHNISEDWNFVVVNREPTVFIVEDDLHSRSECPVRPAIDERRTRFGSKVLVLQGKISNAMKKDQQYGCYRQEELLNEKERK